MNETAQYSPKNRRKRAVKKGASESAQLSGEEIQKAILRDSPMKNDTSKKILAEMVASHVLALRSLKERLVEGVITAEEIGKMTGFFAKVQAGLRELGMTELKEDEDEEF